jgi:hypothetical protein
MRMRLFCQHFNCNILTSFHCCVIDSILLLHLFCYIHRRYDKLKPFGLCIHGCIDGYSRRILWLKVAHTNNNPDVIAHYYVQCVQSLGVCPTVLRTDCGTENGSMAAVQSLLRRVHGDSQSDHSHRYGTSISNQRIEAWWSQFRRGRINFLIGLFKDLVDAGHMDLHNTVHIACCRYVFMEYVQRELDVAATYWNTHRIRPSRQTPSPPGIPDELYFLPPTADCGKEISMATLARCHDFVHPPQSVTGSQDFDRYFEHVMTQKRLTKPWQFGGCIKLYMLLKHMAENGSQ